MQAGIGPLDRQKGDAMLTRLEGATARTQNGRFPSPAQLTASVADVLEAGNGIGIPNFQRGLVWGSEQKAALLESLFRGSPCGALILWKPLKPADEGVSRQDGDACPAYLVLDGQQRIASLLEILGSVDDALVAPGVDDDEQPDAIWWVRDDAETVLPGEPCFRFAGDRAKDLDGWSPLLKQLLPARGSTAPTPFQAALDAILERAFVVELLVETAERNHLAEVVALYNRINQAGLRVSEEERVWARIAALAGQESAGAPIPAKWPSDWLRDMFATVHPPSKGKDWSRNDWLKRQRERNFGFKLFVQVASLAYGYHAGSKKAEPKAIALASAHAWATQTKSGGVATSLRAASDAVRAVAAALEKQLYCDDLRFLPDASHLWPAFLAVIRFPRLAEPWAAPVLGEVVLRSFRGKGEDPGGVVMEAQNSTTMLETLRTERSVDASVLGERLKESQNLGDRYVLLLYWLVRWRGARDFQYSADRELVRKAWADLGHEEPTPPPVKKQFSPEKQHMVPAKELQDSAKEPLGVVDYKSRMRSHVGNGVANVTYISEAQNREGGMKVRLGEGGLMEEVVDLTDEPLENLLAHVLHDVHEGPAKFTRNAKAPANEWFETYCKVRRESIANGFAAFTERVAAAATAALAQQPSEALRPPAEPVLRDRFLEIQRLPVSEPVKDALRKLLDNDRIRGNAVPWARAVLATRLRQGSTTVGSVGIYNPSEPGIRAYVKVTFCHAEIRSRAQSAFAQGLADCWWSGDWEWFAEVASDESEQALIDAIDWLAQELVSETPPALATT